MEKAAALEEGGCCSTETCVAYGMTPPEVIAGFYREFSRLMREMMERHAETEVVSVMGW